MLLKNKKILYIATTIIGIIATILTIISTVSPEFFKENKYETWNKPIQTKSSKDEDFIEFLLKNKRKIVNIEMSHAYDPDATDDMFFIMLEKKKLKEYIYASEVSGFIEDYYTFQINLKHDHYKHYEDRTLGDLYEYHDDFPRTLTGFFFISDISYYHGITYIDLESIPAHEVF